MKITYKNTKLKSLCENPLYQKELVKRYGLEVAQKLPRRIKELQAFQTLNDVPQSSPYRRHKLSENRMNQFAISITRQYRLIFRQVDNQIVIEDLTKIKEIEIMEVSKHYE